MTSLATVGSIYVPVDVGTHGLIKISRTVELDSPNSSVTLAVKLVNVSSLNI
ncbi:MAG: hypothetical protein Q9M43_00200 [Sulfurimonas sp.]|nr:hypothetical protein [Sulfurimonas sp.]